MKKVTISPSQLKGSLTLPPSKSHTMRALIFGALGRGKTVLHRPLISSDTSSMIAALRNFKIEISVEGDSLSIEGKGGTLPPAENVIDAGNSGIVLRFVGALAGLIPAYTIITGDHSIRHLRPAFPLISGLRQLGAFVESSRLDGKAPLIIKGKIQPGRASIDGMDSQPISGLLIAASFLEGKTVLEVKNPGEKGWVDMTLHWLHKLGGKIKNRNHEYYEIDGGLHYDGFSTLIPGDLSSIHFPLIAALITSSEVIIENVDLLDNQCDKELIPLLKEWGAKIEWNEQKKQLILGKSHNLKGGRVDCSEMIDALPILATLGCFCEEGIEIVGGKGARNKESDRIASITKELKKMGAHIEENDDGLRVKRSNLTGASLESHEDHRIAMALSVAALGARGSSELQGSSCIAKTYPTFFPDLSRAGVKIC